jgi:hypothetical protein
MRASVGLFCVSLLSCVASCAATTAPTPSFPPVSPEVKKWEVWIGDWSLTGTARDAPSGPEYEIEWQLHEHWILGGAFVQVDQVWKGNGQQANVLEVLGYDSLRKVHTVSGFATDGSTWSLTARFEGTTVTEDGVSVGADGAQTVCRTTWVFGAGGRSLSGTQSCEQNGKRWIAFTVQGTRTKS